MHKIDPEELAQFIAKDDQDKLEEIMGLLAQFCTERGFALAAMIQLKDAAGEFWVPELKVIAIPDGMTLNPVMDSFVDDIVDDNELGPDVNPDDAESAFPEQRDAINRLQETHGTGWNN